MDFTLIHFNNIPEDRRLLVVNNHKNSTINTNTYYSEYLTGQVWITHIPSAGMYFLRYIGVMNCI